MWELSSVSRRGHQHLRSRRPVSNIQACRWMLAKRTCDRSTQKHWPTDNNNDRSSGQLSAHSDLEGAVALAPSLCGDLLERCRPKRSRQPSNVCRLRKQSCESLKKLLQGPLQESQGQFGNCSAPVHFITSPRVPSRLEERDEVPLSEDKFQMEKSRDDCLEGCTTGNEAVSVPQGHRQIS